MTTWINSQFPRPDFHRRVQRHYGLQDTGFPTKCRIRLTEADLPALRAVSKVARLASTLGPGASNQLLRLVRQYDVYLLALSAWLVIPLPSWIPTIDGGREAKASQGP
jgi:hypothetical protein